MRVFEGENWGPKMTSNGLNHYRAQSIFTNLRIVMTDKENQTPAPNLHDESEVINSLIRSFCGSIMQEYKDQQMGKLRIEDSDYGKPYELKEDGDE